MRPPLRGALAHGADAKCWHSQGNRCVGLGRCLASLPRIPRSGAPHLEEASVSSRVGDEVVGCAVSHRRPDHVPGAGPLIRCQACGQGHVNEAIVPRAARDSMGRPVLSPVARRDEDLHVGSDQCGIVLRADALLESHETLVACERNVVGNLILAIRGGGARARRVQERES